MRKALLELREWAEVVTVTSQWVCVKHKRQTRKGEGAEEIGCGFSSLCSLSAQVEWHQRAQMPLD